MAILGSSFFYSTIVGLGLLGLGLAVRLGHIKAIFIREKATGLYSRNMGYALIPAGIFLLSIYPIFLWRGADATAETDSLIVIIVLFMLPLIALVWQPDWLKPTWLRWIEANYGHVQEKMFSEARKIGGRQWEKQVATQDKLERWADELAQKRKWKRKHNYGIRS